MLGRKGRVVVPHCTGAIADPLLRGGTISVRSAFMSILRRFAMSLAPMHSR